MKRNKKQTTLIIDSRADRLFNIIAAQHGLNNRGEVAGVALRFLSKVQNNTKYPPEIKKSLNTLFEGVVHAVKNPTKTGWADGSDERPHLFNIDEE